MAPPPMTAPEVRGLAWPEHFCSEVRGERLEFSDAGAVAKRASGVGRGIAFVGPLSLENGLAYFEVEVTEMEPNRTQTLALGLCTTLPSAKLLRSERARDLGKGSYVVGYDLPKVFAHGTEVAKVNTKQWRPLKELAVGDRVGLLIDRPRMELAVFVNGTRRTTASGLGELPPGDRWPGEVWGVLDVHGTVRAARLCPSEGGHGPLQGAQGPQQSPQETAVLREQQVVPTQEQVPPPFKLQRTLTVAQDLGEQLATQVQGDLENRPPPGPPAGAPRRCGDVASPTDLDAAGARKRLKLNVHPCGCMVHLVMNSNEVVHIPRVGDFVIGRSQESCNLALDSPKVPNMVSRRHAVIVSAEDAVLLQDCESLNGTYVNGRRIGRETLRQGDQVIIGNPNLSPLDFHFRVSMPPSF